MFGLFQNKKVNDVNLTPEEAKEKNSKLPWVKIVGESVDPEKGIRIELDWNEAFIKYLRKNGYNGSDEEAVVGKWLAHMYKHVSDKMTGNNNQYE